ncbi:MAG: hypothetical protein HY281_10965 [Nitrospirae bacterium]|nr:hypothetical protein [Nitrospirota bacterium]
MPILKCLVGFSDGYVGTCDGIAHEGKLWLVPGWLEHPRKPIAMPERIIRFDNFPHQAAQEGGLDYQNILLPMPESALLGQVPQGIEYVDHPPNLSVPIHELRRQ